MYVHLTQTQGSRGGGGVIAPRRTDAKFKAGFCVVFRTSTGKSNSNQGKCEVYSNENRSHELEQDVKIHTEVVVESTNYEVLCGACGCAS